MTAPTTLDARPATEITPPNHISPPNRRYVTRDERRALSAKGAPTLPEVSTYTTASSGWKPQQDRRATAPASSTPAPNSARPTPLPKELHYTTNSAFTYPMKDKGMDLTIARDHGRRYTYCKGIVCDHQGHKTPALIRPPLVSGVGMPSFRSAPAVGDDTRSATFCRYHRRFDCPLHAAGADGNSSVTTVDLPDIGELDLPPVPVMNTPARFVTDSQGVTNIVTLGDVVSQIEAGMAADEAAGRAFRDAAASSVRAPFYAGHFVL